jgi:predicted nucleic acid-binding protein
MRTYWDSSALVAATMDWGIREKLREAEQFTRTHSFAEVFSTLTGGRLGFRIDAADAAEVIGDLASDLEVTDLTVDETFAALREARNKGVRGGRTHDYLHAAAAVTAGCERIRTLNTSDFEDLFEELLLESP